LLKFISHLKFKGQQNELFSQHTDFSGIGQHSYELFDLQHEYEFGQLNLFEFSMQLIDSILSNRILDIAILSPPLFNKQASNFGSLHSYPLGQQYPCTPQHVPFS
jgi:hypothetical protein